MTDFLLKLLGARVEDASKITGMHLNFSGGSVLGWVLLLILLSALFVFYIYREPSTDIPKWRRHLMASLRVIFLLLLLLIFLKPVLAFTVEGKIRRSLILLLDTSASMQIQDRRTDINDIKRAAIGTGFAECDKGLKISVDKQKLSKLSQISRFDLVKSVLKNKQLNLLERLQKDYDLIPFAFGNNAQEIVSTLNTNLNSSSSTTFTNTSSTESTNISNDLKYRWIDELQAAKPQTAIGDSIREVLNKKRGQPIAGIFLVTDGANNSGSSPLDMAQLSKDEGAPLYIYGIGTTVPRDIIVVSLFAPEVAFLKDEINATVRIKSHGMSGQSAKLTLLLNNIKVDEKEINFGNDAESVVPVKFVPQEKGNFELKAYIEPLQDESVKDNNSFSRQIRIVDQKINVLLIEQYPRWEYRYLLAQLLRDRRVTLKTLLFEADPEVTRAENSPYLEKFPDKKEELFKYDLIIFGDVDVKYFNQTQLENIGELVSRFGGGFIMVAGKNFSPWTYKKSVIEKMLPVEFEFSAADLIGEQIFDKPLNLELTVSGRNSPMLRLSDNDSENAERWRTMPPIYWVARVSRHKPAADVLLVDPDPSKETRFGKMPVIAVQQYGVGNVMFIGTDNLWRWRKNTGEQYYTTLWGQIIQRMSLQRLLGGSKRTQISLDKQNYITGERVNIFARLYTTSFEPFTEQTVKGYYKLKSEVTPTKGTEVTLRLVPDQPGVYRGDFVVPSAGLYRFNVEHDPETQIDFNVAEPRFELGETAMNESLLRQMAQISGGAFLREEDLNNLPQLIKQKTENVRTPVEIDLWCSPLYFLILIAILTVEWVLRKGSQLK